MRPAGYNTSKYTKQDPNDHFGGAFKCLALIIGIIAAIGGLPVGLGLLVAPLTPYQHSSASFRVALPARHRLDVLQLSRLTAPSVAARICFVIAAVDLSARCCLHHPLCRLLQSVALLRALDHCTPDRSLIPAVRAAPPGACFSRSTRSPALALLRCSFSIIHQHAAPLSAMSLSDRPYIVPRGIMLHNGDGDYIRCGGCNFDGGSLLRHVPACKA